MHVVSAFGEWERALVRGARMFTGVAEVVPFRDGRHPRARANQRLATPARARLLYQAAREPISPHSLSKRDRVNIAVLLSAGLLTEDHNRKYIPAHDVQMSLDPIG